MLKPKLFVVGELWVLDIQLKREYPFMKKLSPVVNPLPLVLQ